MAKLIGLPFRINKTEALAKIRKSNPFATINFIEPAHFIIAPYYVPFYQFTINNVIPSILYRNNSVEMIEKVPLQITDSVNTCPIIELNQNNDFKSAGKLNILFQENFKNKMDFKILLASDLHDDKTRIEIIQPQISCDTLIKKIKTEFEAIIMRKIGSDINGNEIKSIHINNDISFNFAIFFMPIYMYTHTYNQRFKSCTIYVNGFDKNIIGKHYISISQVFLLSELISLCYNCSQYFNAIAVTCAFLLNIINNGYGVGYNIKIDSNMEQLDTRHYYNDDEKILIENIKKFNDTGEYKFNEEKKLLPLEEFIKLSGFYEMSLKKMTADELKNVYYKLMKQWHPDNFMQPTEKQKAHYITTQINIAYQQLLRSKN